MPSRIRYPVWIGYWIGLFAIMHRPFAAGGELLFPWADKIVHFALYFLLALLGAWCLRGARGDLTTRFLVGWAAVYAVYGGLDEWLQSYTQRTASVGDWLADICGIAAATVIAVSWQHRRAAPTAASKTGPEAT